MEENSLVEHRVHVAGKCILFLEVRFVDGACAAMNIVVDEFLVGGGGELVLHVLHAQEVVLLRLCVGHVLNEVVELELTDLLLALLGVVDQSLVVILHVHVFLAQLRSDWVLLRLQVAQVVDVLQGLGLRGHVRLVVLGGAVLLGKSSQLRELLGVLEHGAVEELLGSGHVTFCVKLLVAIGSPGRRSCVKQIIKVALDTNGEDSDVLTVGGGLLDKSCVDHAFIFSQRVAAAVADLQGADQLLHKFVRVGGALRILSSLDLVDDLHGA